MSESILTRVQRALAAATQPAGRRKALVQIRFAGIATYGTDARGHLIERALDGTLRRGRLSHTRFIPDEPTKRARTR